MTAYWLSGKRKKKKVPVGSSFPIRLKKNPNEVRWFPPVQARLVKMANARRWR
jgi:hypothetical protein